MSKTLRTDLGIAFPIIKDEGIPLVYVPRADIFTPVLAAEDRAERIRILMQRKDDVLDDCRVWRALQGRAEGIQKRYVTIC